jgi:hypothetical protein
LHAGIKNLQDEVEDAKIAEFAFRATLWHRKVWQDKLMEVGFAELDGNRRRDGLFGGCWHDSMALFEDIRVI